MFIGRQPRAVQQGFVLPTTILLLLVLTLTVGAITLRTLDRTAEATGDRQTQVIYNVATPAIDRAKSKLEYMFNGDRDDRLPAGIPSENFLFGMMVNDGIDRNGDGEFVAQHFIVDENGNNVDPYTFLDETRIDMDGDGFSDNAWNYRVDLNEDGQNDATVAYSIIFGTPTNIADMERASDAAIVARANALQVRHGPLSNYSALNTACTGAINPDIARIERGWFQDPGSSAFIRKNFQVDAYVLPDNENGTVATVEFHQDRELVKGNKWGAWFRNDLEIFPGPRFNWNGAMHTEGNLVVGGNDFRGFLVSSPSSCVYTREASEVTITEIEADANRGIPAFQGQILSARINNNAFNGRDFSHFHLFDATSPITTGDDNIRLDLNRDSVDGSEQPINYTLDPIALVNQDVSQSRGGINPTTSRAADWNDVDKNFVKEGRIYNQQEPAPYLDDFYRADNRYGPKPRIGGELIPGNVGEIITAASLPNNLTRDNLINLNAADPKNVGLDGYWERRAIVHGMRMIVGQSLDLGNAYGWGFDLNDDDDIEEAGERNDPLYPADSCGTRCHQHLQRKTLRDNLGRVQSMAVYHSAHANGSFPAACYALTAHPGTEQTITNSTTFTSTDAGGIYTDFFRGNGTDGWEFEPPAGVSSDAAFANAIATNQPLGIALRNLAHFSGDPLGGAPSFTPTQETGANAVVHPYPELTMWGDFSMLRRILAMLDGGTAAAGNPTGGTVAYNDLSPADKATLHTAACTLGMLAYNSDVLIDEAETAALALSNLTSVGQQFAQILDDNPNNGDIHDIYTDSSSPYYSNSNSPNANYVGTNLRRASDFYSAWVDPNPNSIVPDVENPGSNFCAPTGAPYVDGPGFDYECDIAELTHQFGLDEYITAYGLQASVGTAQAEQFRDLITQLFVGYQLLRDRALGFEDDLLPNILGSNSSIPWDSVSGFAGETNMGGGGRAAFQTSCDPNIFSEFTGGGGGGGASDRDAITLSVVVCGQDLAVRYPAMYYLFPVYDHDHKGLGNAIDWDDQPDGRAPEPNNVEEYITDTYIFDPAAGAGNVGVNDTYTYQVIEDGDNNGIEDGADDGIDTIKIQPRALANWVLPTVNGNGGANVIIEPGGTEVSIPVLDKGVYNGREMMAANILDIDWDMLHDSTTNLGTDANGNGDHWLPNSGVVYSFREDGVREDAIVRPSGDTWTDCDLSRTYETTGGPNNSSCRMEADPANPQDPPLSSVNAISIKPVDFYADPMRRIHGFRLRNGSDLSRANDGGIGLSFVSDNPVYIQDDFNLHQDANGQRIEEFQTFLNVNDFSNFYSRTDLDNRFARVTDDRWRPSEILADGVTILSENFCDGSVEDGIITAEVQNATIPNTQTKYGCDPSGGDRTSFLNQNRPDEDPNNDVDLTWLRQDPDDVTSPIEMDRNGMPMVLNTATNAIGPFDGALTPHDAADFYEFDTGKPLIRAAETRVNAIIISGLVPSRINQAYGGLHNFPRFLEQWGSRRRLHISGSLLQLNFSNYATAPFDQDAWEPTQNPVGAEDIEYYVPPNRLWGYDVGLQYAPAGPIAERFVTPENSRSEFYSEPGADDQYMINLCRQIAPNPVAQCG